MFSSYLDKKMNNYYERNIELQKDGVTMNRKNIGQNLSTLRRQCGMTQAQIAERTGVSTDHISHVEIGSGTISLPLLIEICKLLEATPNDILAGEYASDSMEDDICLAENSAYAKGISFDDVNPEDRMLLNYLYQFMVNRKKES